MSKRKYNDDAEVEERANRINHQFRLNKLGQPPKRKIMMCPRCGGQALLEIVDKQWCYCCLPCGEEIPYIGD